MFFLGAVASSIGNSSRVPMEPVPSSPSALPHLLFAYSQGGYSVRGYLITCCRFDWDSYINHRMIECLVLGHLGSFILLLFFEGREKNFICSNWLLYSRLCLEFISTILAAGLFLRPHKSC